MTLSVYRIPKGKVLTYKIIAEMVGRPGAYRTVGNALNKNTSKNIPSHRVIKSNGQIGGYHPGFQEKIELLRKENVIINRRIIKE